MSIAVYHVRVMAITYGHCFFLLFNGKNGWRINILVGHVILTSSSDAVYPSYPVCVCVV